MTGEGRSRILAVDDDADTADSFAMLLRLWGYDACACYDGPAAMQAAGAHLPQAVLLDVGMPGMDGFQVARLLRRRPELANIAIIGISGYTGEAYRRRAREAGFDHYLLKPVGPNDLGELLGRVTRPNAREDDNHADRDSASSAAGRTGRPVLSLRT
jgi:two-component system CheB/CheR fusion protein